MEGGGRCLIYSTRKRLERAIYLFIRATVSSVSSLLFIRRLLATAIDCVSLTSFVTAAPLDMPLNGTISSRCTRHARFEFRSLVAGHTAGYIRFNGVNSGTFHGIDVGVVFLGAGGGSIFRWLTKDPVGGNVEEISAVVVFSLALMEILTCQQRQKAKNAAAGGEKK